MPGFELPHNLVCAMDEHDGESPRRAWVGDLARIVEDLARRWSLEIGRVFQPGGTSSWVGRVRNGDGEHLVLKVGWRHDEAMHEADGLRAWEGAGAARLVECLVDGQTSALLLEACEPGTALSQLWPATEQDVVVAGLLRRLWIPAPPGYPFRALQAMCDRWADEFDEKYARTDPARVPSDPGIVRAGVQLFRTLSGTAQRCVLLCTDLHPDNVLAAQREPWLVIDPKPYLGDPTYDPLQYMLNHPERLVADPGGFVERMAGLLDLDADRLRQWLFARCVQESLDQPGLWSCAVRLAP